MLKAGFRGWLAKCIDKKCRLMSACRVHRLSGFDGLIILCDPLGTMYLPEHGSDICILKIRIEYNKKYQQEGGQEEG